MEQGVPGPTLLPNFTIVTFKMWAYSSKITNKFFSYKFGQKVERFLQNLAWGGESQVLTFMPNFTIVA